MQETFGCVMANGFHQLLDDYLFDTLPEVDHQSQQQLQCNVSR